MRIQGIILSYNILIEFYVMINELIFYFIFIGIEYYNTLKNYRITLSIYKIFSFFLFSYCLNWNP